MVHLVVGTSLGSPRVIPNGRIVRASAACGPCPPEDEPRMVPSDPLPGPDAQRRLTRSTTDKHIAGVSGGLGRYFGIDPVIFRVGFGAATLVSGIGLIAYLALAAFLPKDDGEPAWVEGRSRVTTIVLSAVLAHRRGHDALRPRLLPRPGPLRRRRRHGRRPRALPQLLGREPGRPGARDRPRDARPARAGGGTRRRDGHRLHRRDRRRPRGRRDRDLSPASA